jgi:hypothetical protein
VAALALQAVVDYPPPAWAERPLTVV